MACYKTSLSMSAINVMLIIRYKAPFRNGAQKQCMRGTGKSTADFDFIYFFIYPTHYFFDFRCNNLYIHYVYGSPINHENIASLYETGALKPVTIRVHLICQMYFTQATFAIIIIIISYCQNW